MSALSGRQGEYTSGALDLSSAVLAVLCTVYDLGILFHSMLCEDRSVGSEWAIVTFPVPPPPSLCTLGTMSMETIILQ